MTIRPSETLTVKTDLHKYFFLNLFFQAMSEQRDMLVCVIQHEGAEPTDDPGEVNIIIEGLEVLQDVQDVAVGCALLLGLIYCLNLEYPNSLKYSFEFIQKVWMDRNCHRRYTSSRANYMSKAK